MLDCLITNGIIVPVERDGEAFFGQIGIKDGRIALIERGAEPTVQASTILDARDQILIPGLVNAHLHPSPSILRGQINHLTIEENDTDPFISGIYARMTEEEAYNLSKLTLFQCLTTGTTSIAMMEYLWRDAALKAMVDLGLSGSFAVDVDATDSNFEDAAQFAQARGIKLLLSGPNEDMPDYFQESFLTELGNRAEKYDVRIHIHLQETKSRTDVIRQRFGKSPIAFLDSIGFLPRAYAIHCTNLDENDINLLVENHVPVIVTPTSEAMLGDGVAPLKMMLDAGITVGMGTDGGAWTGTDDMFREMKTTALLNRAWGGPKVLSSAQVLRLATLGGAKAMGIDQEIGSLIIGKRADIVFVDTNVPHMRPLVLGPKCNILDLITYSATGADVIRTMIAGQIYYDRCGKTVVTQDFLQRCQEYAEDLHNRVIRDLKSPDSAR